ncbi:MAG: hypothetical protein DHS20C18_15120 [Saprospiraceae bacterium]|nr:MAG: hypothetical protein DHS20C18_15120 [Saprospiraceae bacterium]
MKHIILSSLLCLFALQAFTQVVKEIPPSNLQPGQEINLNINPWISPRVPTGENPFGVNASEIKSINVIPGVKIIMGVEGLPISFEGITLESNKQIDESNVAEGALDYLISLHPAGIKDPASEFFVNRIKKDNRKAGSFHVRFQQQFQGIPVFGAELIAHTKEGIFHSAAGRYAPTPNLASVAPNISEDVAIQLSIEHIGIDKVKTDWRAEDLELIGGQPFNAELVIYRLSDQNMEAHLAWHIEAHPNLLSRIIYFIDAQTGEVLHAYDYTCSFTGNHKTHLASHNRNTIDSEDCQEANIPSTTSMTPPPPGPIQGSGMDLSGQNQTFNAWEHSDGTRYLIDTGRDMYNGDDASVPFGNMHGVIITRDQSNVPDGPLTHVTSATNTFNNPTAVSAHVSAGICYEYYKNKFDRSAIDGQGGSVISVINVPESSGEDMDNAYWNGNAMFWGNGNTSFTPLAKSLDVAGHEMTHGVVQETAGLVYENESGALNESFADIFAILIDRDDWTIGEGIIVPGENATGVLRDFANPHNGDDDYWQPQFYSERVTGSDDNGGVHSNSGITNHAFYLFATTEGVGKDIAEEIYYYTLRDRLTASSNFNNLRHAVIAEATEYWNEDIVNKAIAAFDAVGITGGAPPSLAGTLSPNTGTDHVLSVSDDGMNLTLSNADGTLLEELYTGGVLDRPSITDNGESIVFVNNAHQIVGVEIAYNSGSNLSVLTGIVSQDTIWRNVAISKDGRFLAGLTTLNDNKVILFDLDDPSGPTPREYFLVNPTFVQGVEWIDNVQYADVLEFDYSGTQIIYDAYSEITNAEGEHVGHWDIGLLTFWEDGQYTDNTQPQIRKLIRGLGENAGVAQPTFSKNANHLIAYDYYIDQPGIGLRYFTYVANTETGDNGPVVLNGHELAYPSFTTLDDKILYQDRSIFGGNHLRLQELGPNQMAPQGNPSNLILGHKWGLWLNNGSRVHTNTSTGANNVQQEKLTFSVFPNPTSGLTQIEISLDNAANGKCNVTNLLGQSLLRSEVNFSAGENKFDVNLQSLPKGIYLVNILADGKVGTVKLVKE